MKDISLDYVAKTEADFSNYAQMFARQCPSEYSIALHGTLGAGKTTFTRALGKAWHIDSVKSPSFSILDVHKGDRTLIHIDAYRLRPDIKNPFDWDDLCIPPFCIVVEWPECLNLPICFDAHITLEILPENFRRIQVVFS